MATQTLHPVQKRLFDLLSQHIDEPLTVRELQEEIDASSTSVVAHHISQLERKGYLKRNPNDPRDYILLDGPEKQVAYLNMYGLAQCGPKGSILDGAPVDKIPISTRLLTFPSSEGFLVKARGDSMVPRINEGDIVIAQKLSDADNGSIVVCVNQGEALIKKIRKEKNGIILTSLNTAYEPFLAAKDFRIEGVVRGVVSNLV